MKKIVYLSILGLLASACGGGNNASISDLIAGNDIELLRQKRTEISQEQKNLQKNIEQLDSAIAVLNGTENLPLVSTIITKSEKFEHFLELQGNVKTKQNVLVYPEMAGTLTRIVVKEGQKVAKGQVLGYIDDGGLSSQLAQLEAQAALAKTTYERQKRLWDQNIGSEIQYLQAKTSYEAQESAVKQLKSQLGKSTLRAPFSGVVDDVIKDQGTVVAPGPGSEVFRIVNLGNMYVESEVPESHLPFVTVGNKVEVYFPVLGESVQTKVRQTGNYINPGNRSFKIEIPVSNKSGNIKPNLTATVKINDYTKENAILIPQSIVSENSEGKQYVYQVDTAEGKEELTAKKVIVELGRTQGDYVEVTGLEQGLHLISEGARSVRDGQQVQVINDSNSLSSGE